MTLTTRASLSLYFATDGAPLSCIGLAPEKPVAVLEMSVAGRDGTRSESHE